MYGHTIHLVGPTRRSHDARIDTAPPECERKIAQVQLDTAVARQEPVADEGDTHVPALLAVEPERQVQPVGMPATWAEVRITNSLCAATRE